MKTATNRSTPDNHAEQNAANWYETIRDLVAAMDVDYDRLEELRDTADEDLSDEDRQEYAALTLAATVDGTAFASYDDVRERIEESALSVEIRSGWYTPGGDNTPEEFCILLSTGGPALRLHGDLDEHGQPYRAWLEYQDWGTPWTQYFGTDQDTLLAFAQQFYFGE